MPQRPVLVVIPSDDSTFASRAEQLLSDGASTLAGLQGALRADYPKAIVRPRDLSSETQAQWYVYRDGRWIPSVSVAPLVGDRSRPIPTERRLRRRPTKE